MSYQVKKTITFNKNNAQPVNVLKGAILEKDDGEQVIQLKLCNTGKEILSKVPVKITCYGQDKQVLGVQKYEYQKIFVKPGEKFGTNIAIPLQYNATDVFSVEFSDNCESLQVNSSKLKSGENDILSMFYNVFLGIVFCIGLLLTLYMVWCLLDSGVGAVGLAPQVIPGLLFPYALIQIYYSEDKQYNRLKQFSIFFFLLICLFPILGGFAVKNIYRNLIIIVMWTILVYVSIIKRKRDTKIIVALFVIFIIGMLFTYKGIAISNVLLSNVIERIDEDFLPEFLSYYSRRGETIDSFTKAWSFIITSSNLQNLQLDSMPLIGIITRTQVSDFTFLGDDYFLAMKLLKSGNGLKLFSILGIYLWSFYKLFNINFKIMPPKGRRI